MQTEKSVGSGIDPEINLLAALRALEKVIVDLPAAGMPIRSTSSMVMSPFKDLVAPWSFRRLAAPAGLGVRDDVRLEGCTFAHQKRKYKPVS